MSLYDFPELPKVDYDRINALTADFVKNRIVPPSAEQTDDLIDKTSKVHSGVESLAASSQRLESLTEALIKETGNVRQEVAILASSSEKLERLTLRLNGLTWVLIILTFLAIAVPVGVEVWKSYYVEVPELRIALPPPQTALQTPARPPR
jgi:Na+-transporting methylmalonyl-CoA/oxaloacetate decarboxylase gamma subunit